MCTIDICRNNQLNITSFALVHLLANKVSAYSAEASVLPDYVLFLLPECSLS